RAKWRDHLYALNQIVGLHLNVPSLLVNKQPLESAADAEAYLKRLETVGRPFDQLIAHLDAQARQGIYMPKSVYPLLMSGARGVIQEPVETQAIYMDFQRRVRLLDLPKDRKDQLESRCKIALLTRLKPAYEKLIFALSTRRRSRRWTAASGSCRRAT